MANTRDTMHFRVVFNGRLGEGKTLSEVREAFTSKFGEKIARSVFARSNVVLKKGLDREAAERFQAMFGALGMQTDLEEELPAGFQLSLEDEPRQQSLGTPGGGEPAAERPAEKGVIAGRVKPKGPRNETYNLKDIRDAFDGEVRLPEPSQAYKSRLLLVALTMLMLPALYAGLAILSVVLTFWTAAKGLEMLFVRQTGPYVAIVFGVLAIALLLLTAFLFKPLLARRAREPEPVRVDPSREPVLYCLVGEITDAVGAPMPDEILLDTRVNAAAGRSKGPFSSELTLIIGLPLIWGTDVNALAGILAHEFGHFAQKWGTRANHIVRWVNHWFYRQVYLRDRWDVFVEELARHENVFLSLAAQAAQLGSLMCRYILGQLARLASLISLSFTRQGEFDADRYQTGLLGSEQYERIAKRARVLDAAYQATIADLDIALDAGKKVDNLPRMVALRADGFSEEDVEKIYAGIEDVNESIWDTHPADKERIRAARESGLEPKFDFKGSARGLLREIDRLSQMATLQWYRSFGIPTSADDLLPIEAFESETDALTRASESIENYFGSLGDYPLHLELPVEKLVVNTATEKLVPGLAAINEKLSAASNDLTGKRDRLRLTKQFQYNYNHALFWRRAGIEIDPEAYKPRLETTETSEIGGQLARYRKIEGGLMQELRSGAQVLGKKLAVALELARRDDPAREGEIEMLRAAYATVAQTYDDSRALSESCVEMEMLFEACRAFPDAPSYPRRVTEEASRNARAQDRIREILDRKRDPSKPGLTLANVLPERDDVGERDPADVLADAGSVLRQVGRLGFRLLGQMAEIALTVEQEHKLR